MANKSKNVVPKFIKPLQLTEDSVITHMRNLAASEVVAVLYGLWGLEREKLVTKGKKTRTSEDWAEIDGYDQATSVIHRWAQKNLRSELPAKPAAPPYQFSEEDDDK